MEEKQEANLYGRGVEWIGERPISTLDKNSPDFGLVHRLWKEVRSEWSEPKKVDGTDFSVTVEQRGRLLGEPVMAVLFYSLDEWTEEREPRTDYLFFMAGDRFLEELERVKEWGAGI